uniref:EamA domain-containing protein n=1 Tax=Amphora coffeiformis TaxID=265554 RepID=A0A7S3L0E2_9STRA|mmetsp:Transcript_9314/g.17776  ORF Transcript_9314/g.17776 Transcript_9314/m.17776 type:complete len:398 (-) Transcript_9314:119-1312(-)
MTSDEEANETKPLRSSATSNSNNNPMPPPQKRHDNESDSPSALLRRSSSILDSVHHSVLGIFLITAGSLSFSIMFLAVKLMQGVANPFVLAFYRALVEIPMAVALCCKAGESPLGPPHVRAWLWMRGGMGAAAVLCFFYAIQHLPLPDAVTLQFTTPPFAAAFAVCFAGERWTRLDMMGAAVCLTGVVLIAHPSWLFGTVAADSKHHEDDKTHLLAISVALAGAALAGMAYMSVRKIGHEASANVMVVYYGVLSVPVTLVGSRGLLGLWNVWSTGGSDGIFGSVAGVCLVVLTGLTAYAGQYLTNLGLQHETAATGTLATCSQIVFTYLFEMLFLHEAINLWSLAGTVLILGFMVVVGILKMQQADESIHETIAGEPEELALLFSAERDVRRRYNNV